GPRLDGTHDWTQTDTVKLLNEVMAISSAPVRWLNGTFDFDEMRYVRPGQPLPDELKDAAWGPPATNGLRAAWLLEPRANQYPFGSVLRSRVLFHNMGESPIVFRTEEWHQSDRHTVRDAKGNEV